MSKYSDVWTCPKCGGTKTQSSNFDLIWHPELDCYLCEPITVWCMDCQKEYASLAIRELVQFT